jgi:hypothetical protein
MPDEATSDALPNSRLPELAGWGHRVLPRAVTLCLLGAALAAALWPYRARFDSFGLVVDDFMFVYEGRNWASTWESLAKPHNVHLCPAFRLFTGAVVSLAERTTDLARVLLPPSIAVLCIVLLAVYVFLEQEIGSAAVALAGTAAMGFTSILWDTVGFYASTQALWSFLFVVLALIAARRYRRSGGIIALGLAIVSSLLAPCWWTGGILAGPVAALYLLLPADATGRRHRWAAMLPIVATSLYVIAVVTTGLWTPTARKFDVVSTATRLLRGTVETLVLKNIGVQLQPWSIEKWFVFGMLIAAVLVWWCLRAFRRSIVALAGFLWLANYVLVYGHQDPNIVDEGGRYHVVAQFALVLLGCAGFRPSPDSFGRLTGREATIVLVFGMMFWCLHREAIVRGNESFHAPRQAMQLGQLELIADDARQHEIGLDLLREAFGPWKIDGTPVDFDGFTLLEDRIPAETRASPRPSAETVRARLEARFEMVE